MLYLHWAQWLNQIFLLLDRSQSTIKLHVAIPLLKAGLYPGSQATQFLVKLTLVLLN